MKLQEALQKGIEAHKSGRIEEADKYYTAILQVQPKHPDANHNMGVLAVGLSKVKESLPFFKTALENNSSIKQYWLSYISALTKLERYEEAKELLLTAKNKFDQVKDFKKVESEINQKYEITLEGVQKDPSHEDLKPILISHSKGDYEKALDFCNKLFDRFPNSPALLNIFGVLNLSIKKYDSAILALEKAIELAPNFVEVHFNLGNVLTDKGDLEGAIDKLKHALKLNPKFSQAYFNLGNVYKILDNLDVAVENYLSAIKYNPEYLDAHINLGSTFEKLKNFDSAIKCYEECIKIKPDFKKAIKNLGRIYYLKKSYHNAKKYFDKLDDQSSSAISLECLFFQEKLEEYDTNLKKLCSIDPLNIRVAALSTFVSSQLNKINYYPFCKNPLDMIKINNIANYVSYQSKFLKDLIDEMEEYNQTWEPEGKTAIKGFVTKENVFHGDTKNRIILRDIVDDAIKHYRSSFNKCKDFIIREWPKKSSIEGWYVRLIKNGYQDSHIHASGWISGVIYLETIKSPKKNEGAIIFGLHGYDYPKKNNEIPSTLYQPNDGDIILFPSSLFHKTVPVLQNKDRCVIAFDLLPIKN